MERNKMTNNNTIIDNNLLIEFIENCSIKGNFTTLEKALCNKDVILFLEKNRFISTKNGLEHTENALEMACILGLIKNCVKLKIHSIDGKNITDTLPIDQQQASVGFGKFERWNKSESLEQFYENTIPLLELIKSHNLKINALTIVDDVAKQLKKLN